MVLRTRRQGIDLVAVAVAVAGMALLVLPAATAGDGAVTVPGVVFGLLAGLMFATAMMLISSMGDAGVRGSTFALFYCAGSRDPAHAARRLADRGQRLPADVDRHAGSC